MISPAREQALYSLQHYRQTGKTLTGTCSREEDTRLCERIVLGVQQNERYIDYCLSQFLRSDIRKLHPVVLDVLMLSAYQILFLDRIPDSAVVHDAVSLCKRKSISFCSGLVNAVLRRICAEKDHLLKMPLHAAVRYSHPDWLVSRLKKQRGMSFTEQFLMCNQEIPSIRLQINTRKCSLEKYLLLLREADVVPTEVNRVFSSVLIPSMDVKKLPGYTDGLFYIQDDAARASIFYAGIREGMRILDLCAAPGGKSAAAALSGGIVISCDINQDRLNVCIENYLRLGMNIPVFQMDATVSNSEYFDHFDYVVTDVPCTGTGVIRKHPEIRKRTEDELNSLLYVQQQIILNASRYVKPGGILVYSTCSVLLEEDEEQVHLFLDHNPAFLLRPVHADGFSCENGMLRSWPHLNGNDGFFAAYIQKKQL